MSNWQQRPLKEVVLHFIKGATPARSHKEYYCSKPGIPWARVSDLKGGILTETELYLTPEGDNQIKTQVPRRAVLLSVSGTIGKVAIAGRDLKINQAIQAMVFDEKEILPEYAYYYFQYYRPWLETKANLVTIPNLTKTQLENTCIPYPCPEEQTYIIGVMKQAEELSKKNQNTLAKAEQILYSALAEQLRSLPGKRWGMQLGDYLREPVVQGKENSTEASDHAVEWNDILLRQSRVNGEPVCLLVTKDTEKDVFGKNFFRIRVREEKLYPEFLLVWLSFYATYLNHHSDHNKPFADAFSVSRIQIPPVPFEIQDKMARIVRRVLNLRHKITKIEKKTERFYQALLETAVMSYMSKDFRRTHQLEEPDISFIWKHYQVTGPERITGSSTVENVRWEAIYSSKELQMIGYLSEFQKDVLRKYIEVKEPAPIHVIFKKIRTEGRQYDRNYSIQDAIRAVRILEGWGFLESTAPEKVFFGEKEITDPNGAIITIQKYQTSFSD